MNLSHSWEERMMYLASMHFGFPFTNFAFTSTVVISPSSSDKYIPVMSPVALSNTSGFSNVKNAVPDVPSLDFVSFTSGTDVSTESRTKEIVAPFETTNFLLLLKLLLTKDDDCFACFRKEARVVVEARRPTREDKVDIFFSYPRKKV